MATETELKIKVDNLDAIRTRLKAAGAVRKGSRFELNQFFDSADRQLKSQRRGLRLRSMTDEQGETSHVITFKGPATGEVVRQREEIEFTVGNASDAAALLDRLGYTPTLGFEKRRETWHLSGCLVELDDVPHLGTFVEIEAEDEPAIIKVRDVLGLADADVVARGYISMVDELVRHRPELGPIIRLSS